MREFSEEEAMAIVAKLQKGERATMVVDGEEVTYFNPPEPVICKNHFFEPDGMIGEFQAVKCKHCPNGKIIDPKKYHLEKGKIKSSLEP